jgi:hypothetical protein
MSDHSSMVKHDKSDQTDSIAHPFGAKNDLINPFKDVLKEIEDDEDFFENDDYVFSDMRMSEVNSVVGALRRRKIVNNQISALNTTEEDE